MSDSDWEELASPVPGDGIRGWLDVLVGFIPFVLFQLGTWMEWSEGLWTFAGLLMYAWLIAFPLWIWRRRGMRRERAFAPLAFFGEVGLGIAWAFVLMLAVGALGWILFTLTDETPEVESWMGEVARGGLNWYVIAFMVFASTAGPIAEEMFFRGLVYRRVRPTLGPLLAAVFQAAVFAVLHPYGTLRLVQVFALGLGLCWIYRMRRSLLAPIVSHMSFNAVVSALLVVMALSPKAYMGVGGDFQDSRCVIASVDVGSGAETSGLQPGDVIVAIDGEEVASFAELVRRIRLHRPGDVVLVEFERGGAGYEVEVQLGEREP